MMRRFLSMLLVLSGVLAAGGAHALVTFDFEQPMFSEPPEPVLDHCVVEQDGLYHLFYLRGNPAVNIGHATTTDFVHWNMEPPVLSPGTWDQKLWAPSLFPTANGWWLMYYTGVNAVGSQQSGVAFSSNLKDWFKFGPPIYHPDPSWAIWSETEFAHGRDPHVIEYNGTYYMFVTAKHIWNKGAVACATSTDLINWTDAGYIYRHDSWHVLESVFMQQRGGRFHMYFTEEAVYGTSHMSSTELYSGWNLIDRRIIDPGHAPQITQTADGEIFSRHSVYNDLHGNYRHVLRFSPMVWVNDIPAVLKPYPLSGEWTTVSGDAFNFQPTFANNAFCRNDIYAANYVGDGWINTFEFYTGPMGYGGPGYTQGDAKVGMIRSQPFSIQGNSISLLVGGGNFPDQCYVALCDAATGVPYFKETGRNDNVMDRRYWNVSSLIGRSVYVEIADLSTEYFGHICVDDIVESPQIVGAGPSGNGGGTNKKRVQGVDAPGAGATGAARARLLPNSPNPFNPATTIGFEIPFAARTSLSVYDAAGARVRTLVSDTRAAGAHRVAWDGRDDAGRPAASGLYFARLSVNGAVVDTIKLTLLK
jgi:predicted GH43/DUF377 family glycosyl hydrolase